MRNMTKDDWIKLIHLVRMAVTIVLVVAAFITGSFRLLWVAGVVWYAEDLFSIPRSFKYFYHKFRRRA